MNEHEQESVAVERLKRGDIRGLEVLVRLYQEQALDAAYLVTHDYSLAEDVVQDAFLRAYHHSQSFDSNRPFAPWFLRVVINSALTSVSKAANRQALSVGALSDRSAHAIAGVRDGEEIRSLLEIPSLEPGLQEAIETAETREEIISALNRLSPGQRAAVVMRYYLDWNDEEMSGKLGVSSGTVRWRLSRARERLRQLLPSWVTHPQKGEG